MQEYMSPTSDYATYCYGQL